MVRYGRIVGIGWGLQGVIALSCSAFNALDRPLSSTALSLLRGGTLRAPRAWVLSLRFGLIGVFVAALAANVITGAVSIGGAARCHFAALPGPYREPRSGSPRHRRGDTAVGRSPPVPLSACRSGR
jgi:hypothetical protein